MRKLFVIIMAFLVVAGCSLKDRDNPYEPDNSENGSGYISSKSFDADSDEKKQLDDFEDSFNWQSLNGDNMDDPNSGQIDLIGDGDSGQGNDLIGAVEVSIDYLDPYGFTADGYAIYYIGFPMNYRVRIKNLTDKKIRNLEIYATHEYYETITCNRYWYTPPPNSGESQEITVQKGDPLPSSSLQKWTDVEIGALEELVLIDDYTATLATCAGLDQTHIVIKHYKSDNVSGAVVYDNPESGVYCPPAAE